MDPTDTDILIPLLDDGSPFLQQLLAALRIKLMSHGDQAGGSHCIVFGDVKVWWPPEAQTTLHSEFLGKGKWCEVLEIEAVLDKCNTLDIETPEDFGMPLSALEHWIVNATTPKVTFELATITKTKASRRK